MTEKSVPTEASPAGAPDDLKAEQLEVRRVAYSYVRFSTAKQELGDSLRRQVEMARLYAAEHNLRLAETSYQDLGVSGFKGKNAQAGALGAFMAAVKSGMVAPGSFLLIEQFDRLSRDQVTKALRLLLDLVENEITVVTLVDGKVWNEETVQDVTNVLTSVILMSRAHEESKAKSKRLSAVWGQKKALAGKPGQRVVTSECPRWLTVNADKTAFVVLPDRVESIKRVFDMRLNGYGVTSIVTRANKEHWPAPAKGESWHTSLVGRLLHNRALIGEYQPHVNGADDAKRAPVGEPILGYYPVVLDEQIFLRAQAAADRKGSFPGRRDASLKNWLQGLLRCTCGKSFVRKNKNSLAQPGYARYYCTGRNRALSNCPSVSAAEIENAVLNVVSNVAPLYFNGDARAEALKAKAEVLEVAVSAAKQTRDRYAEAIGTSKASIPVLVQRLNEASAQLDEEEGALSAVRAEIADLSGDSDAVFNNIVEAVRSVDSLDARSALRENLSRVIAKTVIHQDDGYIQVFLRGSEDTPVVHPLRGQDVRIPGLKWGTDPNAPPPSGFIEG